MVELKKKVTLRTKTTESSEEVQKPQVALKKKQPVSQPVLPSPPSTGGEEGTGKGKWYAAALAGLLVLGGGGYYLSQQGENEPQSVVAVAGTGQLDETDNEEASEGNQNGQNQEGETPTDAVTAENPSDNTPSSGVPDGETHAAPNPKADAASPSPNSAPSSPSAAQPVQDKPEENYAQTKPVIDPSDATGTVEEEAKEVIRGKHGNGDVRKRNLGDRYAEIQNKVNEMYRNGQVQ